MVMQVSSVISIKAFVVVIQKVLGSAFRMPRLFGIKREQLPMATPLRTKVGCLRSPL